MSDSAGTLQHPAPEMPSLIPSSIVALATVFPVMLILMFVFLCMSFNQRCYNNQRKKEKNNEKQWTPGVEMLREDSVVIHDVGFPDEAYHSVKGNVQAKPEPSPSIFQDDVFLQEVLTVADVYSPTRAILNHNHGQEREITNGVNASNQNEDYSFVTEILEEIIDGLIEEEVQNVNVKRNPSYREAVKRGLDFHDFSVKGHEESSIMTSSLMSIDLNSKGSIEDPADSVKDTSFVDTNELLLSSMKMCEDEVQDDISVTDLTISSSSKWRSTPILDLDTKTRSSGLEKNIDDSGSKSGNTDLRGSESRSYSPVYKLGRHGSFDTSLFSRSSFLQSNK